MNEAPHPEPTPTPGNRAVRVVEATEATPDLLEALHRLVPQLSSSAAPLTSDELEAIVASEASILLLAVDGDSVVDRDGAFDGSAVLGSLTLALFRVPTGLRAWIEDVVVDDAARGRGVGAALVHAAIARAGAAGARSVDLTSRPSREAANRLYVRLGFQLRTTNVYRFEVGG